MMLWCFSTIFVGKGAIFLRRARASFWQWKTSPMAGGYDLLQNCIGVKAQHNRPLDPLMEKSWSAGVKLSTALKAGWSGQVVVASSSPLFGTRVAPQAVK